MKKVNINDSMVNAVNNEDNDIKTINIKTATYIHISFNKIRDDIATVYFLCTDDNDKLFVLDRNIMLEDISDRIRLEFLPMAEEDNGFISSLILPRILNTYLDSYMTDFNFEIKNLFNSDDTEISITGVDMKSKNKYKFTMNTDIFSSIAFINDYIFDTVDNEHDLASAVTIGSKSSSIANPAEFFIVDNIDNIEALASTSIHRGEKKNIFKSLFNKNKTDNSTVAIIMKVAKYSNKDTKDTASILTTFDIGKSYDNSKFRGKTVEDIQDSYFTDADQYLSKFSIMDIRIDDKSYTIIRANNKDGIAKLFVFDTNAMEKIKYLIDKY